MTHIQRIQFYKAQGQEDYPNYNPPARLHMDYLMDMESNLYNELYIEYKNAYDEGFETARLMLLDAVEY
jgi:hypothetical protein